MQLRRALVLAVAAAVAVGFVVSVVVTGDGRGGRFGEGSGGPPSFHPPTTRKEGQSHQQSLNALLPTREEGDGISRPVDAIGSRGENTPLHPHGTLPGAIVSGENVDGTVTERLRVIENRPIFIGHDLSNETLPVLPDNKPSMWLNDYVDFCRPLDPALNNSKINEHLAAHANVTDWEQCFPSFIIVGALKGGTSSLYYYMMQHPEVARAVKKEVCLMRRRYDLDIEEYRKQFFPRPVGSNYVTTEGCPFYFPDAHMAPYVDELMPNTRLILLLRNPVDRLFSMFNMRVRYKNDGFTGNERLEDFINCFRDRFYGNVVCETDHKAVRRFLHEGKYAINFQGWLDTVPLSPRWIIIKSEEFYEHEHFFTDEVIHYLGLHPHEYDKYTFRVVNFAPPKDKHIIRLPEDLRSMLEEYYAPYNRMLYDLLDFDFGWPEGKGPARDAKKLDGGKGV